MIEEKYLAAYFAKQKQYYIERFQQFLSGNKFTFNVGAFLFGPFWLVYRKMYLFIFAFVGFAFVLGLFEELSYWYFGFELEQGQLDVIAFCIMFSINLGLSFGGNYLYLKRASKDLKTTFESTEDEEERIKLLRKKGGVSWFAVTIAIIVYSLIIAFDSFFEQAI